MSDTALSEAIVGAAKMELMRQQPRSGFYTLMACKLEVTKDQLILAVPPQMLHLVEPENSQVRKALMRAAEEKGAGDRTLVLRGL